MAQAPPPFALKQATDISTRKTAELREHAATCFAKYFTGEGLQGRAQVYQASLASPAGPVGAANQHPLLAFLATPKLPPELAAYIDPMAK